MKMYYIYIQYIYNIYIAFYCTQMIKRTLVSVPAELQSKWFWKHDQLTFIWILLLLSEKERAGRQMMEGVQFHLPSYCSMTQLHM